MLKNWRVNLVLIAILLCGAAIISRLVFIQILNHDLYKALANGQQNSFKSIKGQRGQIFFNKGEILATNVKAKYLFVCPEEIKNKEEAAQKISEILKIPREDIFLKLQKDSLFEKIKNILTPEEETALNEANLAGVYTGEAVLRNYPQKYMASRVVGFVGGEGAGQYGVEGFYEDVLRGKEDFVKPDPSKNVNGSDVFLTIDYNLQYMAEKLLLQAKDELAIEGGQIIAMDPNTGEILAMADFPGFDPNFYSETEDFDIFQNSSVQKLFEPGSTLKPITMAAALDLGKITPQTTYIDEGKLRISDYVIENYAGRIFGKISMTQVLEKSVNTGAVFAEKQIGGNKFLEYLDRFNFFDPTGIDIQGEAFSDNKELRRGFEINFATAAYGQGIEITPIQLVRAFAAIANGGSLVKPYIADKTVDADGEEKITKPKLSDKIISSNTISKLTAMLVSVIENGFSKSVKIPGYYIAGKTGTAQIPWSALGENKKGYSNKTWQSFIGFFPAFNPKVVLFVKLDNPKANTAEYSAAPIFRQMAKYTINYLAIPPDYGQ